MSGEDEHYVLVFVMVIGCSITVRSVRGRVVAMRRLHNMPAFGDQLFDWYDVVVVVSFFEACISMR